VSLISKGFLPEQQVEEENQWETRYLRFTWKMAAEMDVGSG